MTGIKWLLAVLMTVCGWVLFVGEVSDASADARLVCAGLLLVAGAIMRRNP